MSCSVTPSLFSSPAVTVISMVCDKCGLIARKAFAAGDDWTVWSSTIRETHLRENASATFAQPFDLPVHLL